MESSLPLFVGVLRVLHVVVEDGFLADDSLADGDLYMIHCQFRLVELLEKFCDWIVIGLFKEPGDVFRRCFLFREVITVVFDVEWNVVRQEE